MYSITGGQTGAVFLAEKSRWFHQNEESRVESWTTGSPATVNPDSLYIWGGDISTGSTVVGADNHLTVVTPNGAGKGGSMECLGDCTPMRPTDAIDPSTGGPIYEPESYAGEDRLIYEEFGTGEGIAPNGLVTVELLDRAGSTARASYDVTDDYATCVGAGCAFTVYHQDADGNGGGAVCSHGGSEGGCYLGNSHGTSSTQPWWTACR